MFQTLRRRDRLRQTDRQIVCDKQTYEKDKESQTKRQRQKKLNGFQVRAQKGRKLRKRQHIINFR